jgi:hypothetical protein
MLTKKSTRWFPLAMLLGLLICSISIGCQTIPASRTPQMGEEAVIDLPLGDRPYLDLTDEEAIKIYKASPGGFGKLLKNQARWFAYADIAVTVKDGYKDYLRGIFAKPDPPKKWFKFWQ